MDDSRQTLAFAVKELQADIAAQEAELEAAGQPVPPTHLAVFVIHCKQRTKAAELPAEVPEFVAQVGGGGVGRAERAAGQAPDAELPAEALEFVAWRVG